MAASSALYAAHPVDKLRAQIRLIYLDPCPSREDNTTFASHLKDLGIGPQFFSGSIFGGDWNRGEQDQVKGRLHLANLEEDLS
jgi:hypothetical protein